MKKIKVLPLGSCRIYRPFLKKYSGVCYDNTYQEIEVVYPKVGFFHSLNEIAQTLQYFKVGIEGSQRDLAKLMFRKEPVFTTPLNEFDDKVWQGDLPLKFHGDNSEYIDVVIIEVSSLDSFYSVKDETYFHWNPNSEYNISYSEIYPDGFYSKLMPELGVQRISSTEGDIARLLDGIVTLYPKSKIIITGHINDPGPRSRVRAKLNSVLYNASESFDSVFYLDNRDVFLQYGYAIDLKGNVDIHHLSHDGEVALGNFLQNKIIDLVAR